MTWADLNQTSIPFWRDDESTEEDCGGPTQRLAEPCVSDSIWGQRVAEGMHEKSERPPPCNEIFFPCSICELCDFSSFSPPPFPWLLSALAHWSSKSLKLAQSFEQGKISGELPLSAFPGVMALSNASLGPRETGLRGLPALEEEACSRCLSSNSLGVCAATHRGPDTGGSSPAPSSAS